MHETGAIEATGHKVIVLPTTADGRLTAAEIRKAYEAHWNDAIHEHMYSRAWCIFLSPQRMAPPTPKQSWRKSVQFVANVNCRCLLMGQDWVRRWQQEDCDHTLQDIARLADVFYIGGTKVGAMMGDAVVIVILH